MALSPPVLGEISSRQFTDLFLTGIQVNPDEILAKKGGGDYSIYDRLLSDDQCKSAFQQRRLAVTRAETMVEAASDAPQDKAAAEFVEEMLDALSFDDKCDKMLYGLWFGHAVGECIFKRDGRFITLDDIKVRPSRRFRYGDAYNAREGEGIFETTRSNLNGELRPARKYWTYAAGAQHDENPYGIGLAHYCYWPVWFKRNDVKFWLIFLEKFGAPTIKAEVSEAWIKDDKKRDELLEMLDAVQTDGGVLIPEGAKVELLEAARSGTADYSTMRSAMDEAIAKIILSQTLTLENDGGQFKATMQKEVRDEVIKADADLLMGTFNAQVVRWLTEWNFANARPPRVWRNLEEKEDLNTRAERDTKISALGYRPTKEYVRQNYGDGFEPDNRPGAGSPALSAQEAASFAESAAMLAAKTNNRVDQEQLVRAARDFSNRFESVIGPRVTELLDLLDHTDDLVTFRERLRDLMLDQPDPKVVETINRGTFASRLLGLLRGQG